MIALAYFEMPKVQERLDYHPQAWIDKVKVQREETYRADIHRHQSSVLAADPLPHTEPQATTPATEEGS